MTFGRQSHYDFLDEHPWYRPFYSQYAAPYHPHFGQTNTNLPFTKGQYAPQNKKHGDNMERDMAAMPDDRKSSVVIAAMKTNPNKTDEIMLRSFVALQGNPVALANLKADLVEFNPAFAKKIQNMDPNLTDTSHTDLTSVGPKIKLAMLAGGVHDAKVADNLNFSHLPGAGVVNLQGITSAGMTLGHQQIVNAEGAKVRQENKPDPRFLGQHVDTGHQVLSAWDFKADGSTLGETVAETASSKVTPDGDAIQPRQKKPQWALDGMMPDSPSPFSATTST